MYYALDPAKALEANARWRAKNPSKAKAASAAWRLANRDVVSYQNKAYRSANLSYLAAKQASRYAASPEKYRAISAIWRAANPGRVHLQRSRRRGRLASAEGSYTAEEIRRLFVLQKGKCAYAGLNRPNWCLGKIALRGCHHDHITSLAKGGENWIRNIQLLCAPCNLHKSAKDPIAFAQELGYLI
jgi:5-methylcytosine-specific restriction endonuclease McrA